MAVEVERYVPQFYILAMHRPGLKGEGICKLEQTTLKHAFLSVDRTYVEEHERQTEETKED